MTVGWDFALGFDVCCKGAGIGWELVDGAVADKEAVGRGGFGGFTTGPVVLDAPGADTFNCEYVDAKFGSYLCRINVELRGLDAST